MQRYRLKTGGKAVEVMFGWRKIVGKEGEAGRDYRAIFQSDNGDLADWDQRLFAAEYKRVEEKTSLRHCKACGHHMALGGEYELNGVGPYCFVCYGLIKETKESCVPHSSEKPLVEDDHAKPFGYERHSYGFHAFYICARCGKAIDECDGFAASGSPDTHGDGRHREAVCLECWGAPPLNCASCGKDLTGEAAVRDTNIGRWLCHACGHAKFPDPIVVAKPKPKPLTLADLKPGDVFVWTKDGTCALEKQLLKSDRFYSVSRRCVWFFRAATYGEGVKLLHHLPLTPKQLLWVAASYEERKALEDSIRDKWLPIMRGQKWDEGTRDCPCCRHAGRNCSERCLISRYGNPTGGEGCADGHHTTYCRARSERSQYYAARDFALWLAMFLPNIHPLRIEVEATPIEWPGMQK